MSEDAKFTPITPVKPPSVMSAVRVRYKTPYGHMHITVAVDLKTGREIEIFSQIGKSGAATAAELEGICRLASLYLRAGGQLKDIIKQLKGIGSVLDGLMAGNDSATSVPDSLARALQEYADARDKYGIKALVLGETRHPEESTPPSPPAAEAAELGGKTCVSG